MYQHTVIVGYLGRDPEMRYTQSGDAVTNFSVAVSRKWTNQDGTPGEKTTWFRVSAWRRLAETCNQYLSKGRPVLVEGEVSASAWTPQDGGDPRANLELRARNVQFLPGREAAATYDEPQAAGGEEIAEDAIPF